MKGATFIICRIKSDLKKKDTNSLLISRGCGKRRGVANFVGLFTAELAICNSDLLN